jgi:hypothetical protein
MAWMALLTCLSHIIHRDRHVYRKYHNDNRYHQRLQSIALDIVCCIDRHAYNDGYMWYCSPTSPAPKLMQQQPQHPILLSKQPFDLTNLTVDLYLQTLDSLLRFI